MTTNDSTTGPSRRAFIAGACGLAAIAATGTATALLADDALAATGIRRRKNGTVIVDVDKVPALSQDNSRVLLGNVKGTPVAIVRQGDTYSALNLRCTHQGATVDPQSTGWRCPAHGSLFALDGDLERGPAPTPLAEYTSRWNARNRRLTVG